MGCGMRNRRVQRPISSSWIPLWVTVGALLAPACEPASDAFDLKVHLVFPDDQEPLADVDLLQLDIDYLDGTQYAFYLQPVADGNWRLDHIPDVVEGETATLTLRGMVSDPADPGNALEVANGTSGPVVLGDVADVYVYFSERRRFGAVGGPLTSPRAEPQVVALPGGEAVVFGGRSGGGGGNEPSLGIERLTRDADGVYVFELVNYAYHRLGAAVVRVDTPDSSHDGQVLVAGGWEEAVTGTGIVAKVDRWDPASGALSTVFDLPNPLAGAVATGIGDGAWLLSGGTVSWGSDTEPNSRYVELDAVAGEAVQGVAMEMARYDHAATMLAHGGVLVCGGYRSGAVWDETTGHCEIWTGGETTDAGSMNVARAGFALLPVPGDSAGRVLAVGGVLNPEDDDLVVLDSAELYDPETDEWTLLDGHMTEARRSFGAFGVGDQRVVVCGGADAADVSLESCEAFDLATEAFSPLPDAALPGGRSSYGTALLDNGLMLVVGGEGVGADTAYLYNP